ncbi:MAG: penicillin acylase family protein [Thermoleophilaceae bacterium]
MLACLLVLVAAPAASAFAYRVTIQRTSHGIPHILAGDWGSLGYGYGYALAHDDICPLADVYMTVDAERSKFLGAGGSYDQSGSNGTNPNNLNSDFFYAKAITQGTVERLVGAPAPAGPLPQVREGVDGYVAGYNRALAAMGGSQGVSDPACKGKPWVRPIAAIDVWRRVYQLQVIASTGVAIDGIASAAPPDGGLLPPLPLNPAGALQSAGDGRFDHILGGLGSNAVALGSSATSDGHGLLLGNPHFPWKGPQRFYEAQLTIPGQVDVAGASLLGVPLINIGFTRGLAWSHTVSTARRFVPYELKLVPGQPTAYFVDGQVHRMRATQVTVQARQADGSLAPVTRTLYDSDYGPMLTSILGLPVFPWSTATAYAMYDGNGENFGRLVNHFLETNQAQSVPALDAIEHRYQGIPWVNTIASDTAGNAYYADIGSIPNVPADKYSRCLVPLGQALDRQARVPVLDGSNGSCAPGSAPGAAAPGILPPSLEPSLRRNDFVTNSNDSYWLSNPAQPLEGFSRIIGDERVERSPRTRLGLRIVQQRLDGSDGAPGRGFSSASLMDAVFNDRQYLGELWRDPLVALCRSNPTLAGSSGPVDVSGACDALSRWDLHANVDSRGTLLFNRFATRALAAQGGPYSVPFDPADPVNTPRGLNTSNPQVRQALADAVTDLRGAGLALDAPLGDGQYELRGSERIPIHGGPGTLGIFNAINTRWDPHAAYAGIPHGSSYVQVVHPTGAGCVDAHTILTYSLSTDPTSPWYADQTQMFSRKQWVKFPFCQKDILADPALQVTDLGGGYRTARCVLAPTRRHRSRRRGRHSPRALTARSRAHRKRPQARGCRHPARHGSRAGRHRAQRRR